MSEQREDLDGLIIREFRLTRRELIKGAGALALAGCAAPLQSMQPIDLYGPPILRTPSGLQDFEGHKRGGRLLGIDYDIPVGTPVVAPARGRIFKNEVQEGIGGICIWLDHGYFYVSFFAHLQKSVVHDLQDVERGQLIAYSGDTGRPPPRINYIIPHLHWGVFKNDKWLDPDTMGLNGGRPTYWDGKIPLDIKFEHEKVYADELVSDVLSRYKFKDSDILGLRKYIEGKERLRPSVLADIVKKNPQMFEPDAMDIHKRRAEILWSYKNMVFSLPFQK